MFQNKNWLFTSILFTLNYSDILILLIISDFTFMFYSTQGFIPIHLLSTKVSALLKFFEELLLIISPFLC